MKRRRKLGGEGAEQVRCGKNNGTGGGGGGKKERKKSKSYEGTV